MSLRIANTLAAVVLGTIAVWAADSPVTQWLQPATAQYADSRQTGTSIGSAMTIDNENAQYVLHSIGTFSADDRLLVGNTEVGHGTPYTGTSTSGNQTMCLTKVNAQGQVEWNIHSTTGELNTNQGGVTVLPDGDIAVSFVIRHTEGQLDRAITLVDGTGATVTLPWVMDSEKRYYNGFVAKVNHSTGRVMWVSRLSMNHDPQPDSSEDITPDALSIGSTVSDSEGRIFVCGRYSTAMTFDRVDGTVTLTPHNTAGWNGSVQNTRGDLFVLRFNGEGLVDRVLVTGGVAKAETQFVLKCAQGDLWLNGTVIGSDDATAIWTVGDKSYGNLPDAACMFTARLDTDFSFKWQNLTRGVKMGTSTGVLQYNHLDVTGDDVWVTGMGNFNLVDDKGASLLATAGSSPREGYLVRMNAADGRWLAGTTSRLSGYSTTITGYMGVVVPEDEPERVLVYGHDYDMSDGVFLREYNRGDLSAQGQIVLLSGGAMPSAGEMAVRGDRLYTMSRSRGTTTGVGSDLSVTASKFTTLLACHALPFTAWSEPALKTGDVDGDGIVDVQDTSLLIEVILGKKSPGDLKGNCDLNNDGSTDVDDLNTLIDIILGRD